MRHALLFLLVSTAALARDADPPMWGIELNSAKVKAVNISSGYETEADCKEDAARRLDDYKKPFGDDVTFTCRLIDRKK